MTRSFAHRGFSGAYPENTMLSFSRAVDAGAYGIELDVHLSRDGEVMIIHDEALARTTGHEGMVKDYGRSELERMNAGRTKDDSFGFTPIPSLEEYLDFMKDKSQITNIEIKTFPYYYPSIEEKTLDLIDRFGMRDRIIFSSFNWMSIERVATLAPDIPRGLLIEGFRLQNMGSIIGKNGHSYYHPDYRLVDKAIIDELHANSVGINVWTVDEVEDMKRFIALGVDGIITNRPDRLIPLLQAMA